MEKKFRLFLLLVLLLTAATGAWAEDIVISPASGANISTALATATDGKTVGNITINLAQNGAYTVSSAMEVPAGLTINGNGATINAKSLTEGNGMFLGTGKDSPTRADIQISDLTIKSLGKSLYYSNGQNNYGDFIMNNCLVEVTSSVIVFNYTKGSAVVNLTLNNSTFYAPTATTTQFYSSMSGQKLTAIINNATQEFSFQNCTLYNMAKNKNFFVHRQNNQKWLSYEAKNSIFVNCGKSGEVVKGMNGGSANVNPTWSIDGNLFNYDGADTSANETTGDTSEGEGVQNSVAGVVTFKDPSNGDFSGIITKSDNSTVDLTLGDPRWTAAAEPATYTVSLKDGVKDADKWTVKVGEGEAQDFPVERLEGGEKITVTYTGTKKVIGMKVENKVAAPTYTLLSAATTSDVGKVVCAAGHLHDAKTAVPSGCTAVGILGKVTTTGHGLILALKDAPQQTWNTINDWTSASYAGTTLKVLPDDDARGTNLTSYTTLGETTVSNWAVAQIEDYDAIFKNLGSTKSNSGSMLYDDNVNDYITTGVGGTALSGEYWSAAEYDNFGLSYTDTSWDAIKKNKSKKIRPVLGF